MTDAVFVICRWAKAALISRPTDEPSVTQDLDEPRNEWRFSYSLVSNDVISLGAAVILVGEAGAQEVDTAAADTNCLLYCALWSSMMTNTDSNYRPKISNSLASPADIRHRI